MERDEFLKTLGISFAMVCAGSCFQSCGKKGGDDTGEPGSTGSTASVDISSMTAIGSKATANGVLFFRIAAGTQASAFIATESVCTHEQGELIWLQNGSKIQCQNHGAEFNSAGMVTQGPATRALKIYPVTLTGTILTATKS